MKRVVTALILAPLVLALVFFGPRWLVTLATAAIALLAAWEFLDLTERCGAHPPRGASMAAIAGLFLGSFLWPDMTLPILSALALALLVYCTFARPAENVLVDATSAVFGLFYIGVTLLTVPVLREQPSGPTLVVFLLFVVWAGDITALYVGRSLGRRKLAPTLSPNKTWEGAIGSIAGSLAVTGLLFAVASGLARWDFTRLSLAEDPVWWWLLVAVVVNVAAQVGDLAESALKRSAGVKDSGTLLPGHGGVLDRIDALLLAAPVLWYAQFLR